MLAYVPFICKPLFIIIYFKRIATSWKRVSNHVAIDAPVIVNPFRLRRDLDLGRINAHPSLRK